MVTEVGDKPVKRLAHPLLPDRFQQPDLFICDIFDAAPKSDMAGMEHPVFSISKKPDHQTRRYENGENYIEISPSAKGMATVFDRDILIFCISQLMAALNKDQPVSRHLTLTAHDLLLATHRETSGDAYRRLREAFERLAGTRITTNIATGAGDDLTETTTGFGLIESWEIVRKTRKGRMVSVSVTLSEWVYRAVLAKSVLTLSREYFTLRRPLERRLYALARKHCGNQPRWQVSVATLAEKSGSRSPRRVFRAMLREIIAEGHLPDYRFEEMPGDLIRVTPRRMRANAAPLAPETLEAARAAGPGADVYALEARWRAETGGQGGHTGFLAWIAQLPA